MLVLASYFFYNNLQLESYLSIKLITFYGAIIWRVKSKKRANKLLDDERFTRYGVIISYANLLAIVQLAYVMRTLSNHLNILLNYNALALQKKKIVKLTEEENCHSNITSRHDVHIRMWSQIWSGTSRIMEMRKEIP